MNDHASSPRPSGFRFKGMTDVRFWLLLAAALFLVIGLLLPSPGKPSKGVDLLVVVDITGSMNTRDYMRNGQPMSRLEAVKADLRAALPHLPCPARIALAIFTERRPFLLFEPIDACASFEAVDKAINALDWRMAWEGDSHIASGLYQAIDMAAELHTDLLFATDGQEAPPLPATGAPEFRGDISKVKGLILGTGASGLSPIPKYDENGREIGFYKMEDVQQENRFGAPPPDAEKREGYQARNAPFGAAMPKGNEHLSSVREPYLTELAAKTGLSYARLTNEPTLTASLEDTLHLQEMGHPKNMSAIVNGLALLCLLAVYGLIPLVVAARVWRRTRRLVHKHSEQYPHENFRRRLHISGARIPDRTARHRPWSDAAKS